MTKVFELSNSQIAGPGTNFVRLPHSLDFAGRLKAVSIPRSRLLESLRTLARLHHAVRNTFSPFLTIIMAKSCLHLLLGTVYVKPSNTCIYGIKWCQPKCPERSSLLWPFTVISESCFWEPHLYVQTLGTSGGQRQLKALTGDYFIITSSVVFFWSSRMSFRRLLHGRKWKTVCKRSSIYHH